MPRDKDFKRRVRRRMDRTGERYTEAREQLRAGDPAIEWRLVGERADAYELTAVRESGAPGGLAHVVRCVGDPGGRPGGISGSIGAAEYHGRRVRFSAQLRAEAVTGWSGLWMRVDGAEGEPLAFGSTQRDPLRGTSGWTPRQVVLDVPAGAERIAVGSILGGPGVLRLAGVRMEPVEDTVSLSGLVRLGDWTLDGSRPDRYELRREPGALVLRSVAEVRTGFGSMSRVVPAEPHRGGRLRLSAAVRGEVTRGWAGLWMRVDDADRRMLRFDNMEDRPLRGPFHWTDVAVVLDVPAEAATIAHGALLSGEGLVRVADVQLESVDEAVPLTGVLRPGDGWFLSGGAAHAYELTTDLDGERRVGVLRSVADPWTGWGGVVQTIAASGWRGRRIIFRAALKGDHVEGAAGLWFGVLGPGSQQQAHAERLVPRQGTFGWTPVELPVEVPPDAALVTVAVTLHGRGTVRIADASLDARELAFDP